MNKIKSKFFVPELFNVVLRNFGSKCSGGKGGGKDGGKSSKDKPTPPKRVSCKKSADDKSKGAKDGGKDKKKEPVKLSCKKGGDGKKPKSPCDIKKIAKQGKAVARKSEALRKICLFMVIPGILVLSALMFTTGGTHERDEFKKWDHLRKRDKRFPWGEGEKSLFHNRHMNALPDGYEDED